MIPPAPACPVRGCGELLGRLGRRWECPRGHSFDVARSGHLTLLQPQDKRSAEPGDSAESVAARRRALAFGAGDELARTVVALVQAHAAGPAVLDVGCGDGFFLQRLAEARPVAACGIDLSRAAAEAAARRLPDALVVVGNADRALPWPDATFDVVLSITARRPVAEMRRVLRPSGLAVVAVPSPDDLVELREAVQGRGETRDRIPALIAEMSPSFAVVERRASRVRRPLDAAQQRDLLASTYRGARASSAAAVEALAPREVTLAQDVVAFRPTGG